MFIEHLKKHSYQEKYANLYYWRTYDQKEIDLVEEYDGIFHAYEFKWNKSTGGNPKTFLDAYKNSKFEIVNRENYWEFLTGKKG
jgi:hypothetical protein